jgi:hypothetical protein
VVIDAHAVNAEPPAVLTARARYAKVPYPAASWSVVMLAPTVRVPVEVGGLRSMTKLVSLLELSSQVAWITPEPMSARWTNVGAAGGPGGGGGGGGGGEPIDKTAKTVGVYDELPRALKARTL